MSLGNKTINFCTLFDSNYMDRGILLYRSLEQYCSDFHLFLFALDDLAIRGLTDFNFVHATIISLKEFENERLLKIKPTRSKVEYMWTISSSTILYILTKFNVTSCTYIDADLFFYSDPRILIDELSTNSVLITEHRYTPEYDRSKEYGKYCVQFMTFRNNEQGLKTLNWWVEKCIEWCYGFIDQDRFGDQKYLDDWTERFEGVHVLQHIGGGVAPWNMQKYRVDDKLNLVEIETLKKNNLIFFHFHGIVLFSNKLDFTNDYFYPKDFINCVFIPYARKLIDIRKILTEKYQIEFINRYVEKNLIKRLIWRLIRIIKGHNKIVSIK